MTLAITHVTADQIIHVCDKTISTDRDVVSDIENKMILLWAQDGVLSISYSGLALLHEAGTDHWMAEQICGRTFDPNWTHSLTEQLDLSVQGVINTLRTAFERQAGQKMSVKRQYMKIVAAGYHWSSDTANLVRPVVFEMTKEPRKANFDIKGTSLPSSLEFLKGKQELYFCPAGYVSLEEKFAWKEEISECTGPAAIAELLREKLREKAAGTHRIGASLQTITLPHPVKYREVKPRVEYDHAGLTASTLTPLLIYNRKVDLPFEMVSQKGIETSLPIELINKTPVANKPIKISGIRAKLTPIILTNPVKKPRR